MIAALCCVYITVIKIAGMYQFNIVSRKLASVIEILYKNKNYGKGCAFNETGKREKGPLFVRTFTKSWTSVHNKKEFSQGVSGVS